VESSKDARPPAAAIGSSVATVEPFDGGLIVTVTGEVDLASSPGLMLALDEAVEASERVVIDLGRAAFVDSTALAGIVRAAQRLDPEMRRLGVVLRPGSQPARVWKLCGLSPPIPSFVSRADAARVLAGV